jgi:hypothetical protein
MTTRIDETNSRGYRILGMLHRMWSRLKCLRVQEMRPTGSDGFQSLFNGAGSKWMFRMLEVLEALCVAARVVRPYMRGGYRGIWNIISLAIQSNNSSQAHSRPIHLIVVSCCT